MVDENCNLHLSNSYKLAFINSIIKSKLTYASKAACFRFFLVNLPKIN